MKITLLSMVGILFLFGCESTERNLCVEPVNVGNQHSISNCPCFQIVQEKVINSITDFYENEQRLQELGSKAVLGVISEDEIDEGTQLIKQNELLIKVVRAQERLRAYHKEIFHPNIKYVYFHIEATLAHLYSR